MATLTMPAAPGFQMVRFGLQSNAKVNVSPTNLSAQTLEFAGSIWSAVYTLPPMKREDAAEWQAFFVKLRGMAGRFYGYDPGAITPRGTATGTPLLAAALAIAATSASTDGWTAGVTGILKAGDYFQIGTELHMVTADANSNGSGQATIVFEPPRRVAANDNAAITTNTPKCIMRLTSNDQSGWDISTARFYGMTFAAVESFT